MKNKLFLLLFLLIPEIVSCQYQIDPSKFKDEDFKKYVSNFKQANLPFSTYNRMSCPEIIEEYLVKKFICKNESCLKDWSGYNIEFGPCVYLPSKGDYIILIHDESTEGGTIRKLTTYDYQGKKIGSLEIFAEKPFHGDRPENEITYYEVESNISKDYIIEKKYFASEQEWTEGKEFFYYGTHVEYRYKIECSGKITLLEEKKFGRKKYKGVRLKTNEFPRYMLAE